MSAVSNVSEADRDLIFYATTNNEQKLKDLLVKGANVDRQDDEGRR